MKSQEKVIEIAVDGRLFCKRRQTAMRKTAFRTPKDGKTEGKAVIMRREGRRHALRRPSSCNEKDVILCREGRQCSAS